MKTPSVRVGTFLIIGLALGIFMIFTVGSQQNLFTPQVVLSARFGKVEGLDKGAMVRLGGIVVGSVRRVQFDEKSNNIVVTFGVNKNAIERVKTDSYASIRTMGVLGDKYLLIEGGSESAPVVKEATMIAAQDPGDLRSDDVANAFNNITTNLNQILQSASQDGRTEKLIISIINTANAATKTMTEVQGRVRQLEATQNHLNKTLESLSSVVKKVDQGQGTLGLLINDAELYDDLKSVVGGAERNKVLQYFIRSQIKSGKEQSVPRQ